MKTIIFITGFCAIFVGLASPTIDNFPVLSRLECEDCERVYVPVCGSDNRTYVNHCRLKCENNKRKHKRDHVKLRFYGKCVEISG